MTEQITEIVDLPEGGSLPAPQRAKRWSAP